MSKMSEPPNIRVFVDGNPQPTNGAINAEGRPYVRVLEHDGFVTRRVAPGQTLEFAGKNYAAGELVRIPTALSNDLLRRGVVLWPDDGFDAGGPVPRIIEGSSAVPFDRR